MSPSRLALVTLYPLLRLHSTHITHFGYFPRYLHPLTFLLPSSPASFCVLHPNPNNQTDVTRHRSNFTFFSHTQPEHHLPKYTSHTTHTHSVPPTRPSTDTEYSQNTVPHNHTATQPYSLRLFFPLLYHSLRLLPLLLTPLLIQHLLFSKK